MTWLSDEVVGRLRDVAARPELPPGRYSLIRPLGRGGMGTVYAARDELLGRDVALKVSNAPVADSGLEARLRREARVLARLEHPGIVPVHDAGLLPDGRLFYVMKLVRGETLTEHVQRLDSEAAILLVFERVVETVAFAHAAGIVHRDLKPSNIMVGSFGEVLVLDWGVAKVAPAQSPHQRFRESPPDIGASAADPKILMRFPESLAGGESLAMVGDPAPTADGIRIGTPGFMAPEQARGEAAAIGPTADVFSLGALLAWMLTRGSPPGSPEEVARRLKTASPPVGRRLRALALKCVAPEPAGRYTSAAELAADLGRYRAGQAVVAYRETPFDRLERWFTTYRTAILLIAAYLVMRAAFALTQR